MPAKRIYTNEQREQVLELYWKGRDKESHSRGAYTMKEISEKTGVSVAMIHAIGRGHR